jgi:hypothetical protein
MKPDILIILYYTQIIFILYMYMWKIYVKSSPSPERNLRLNALFDQKKMLTQKSPKLATSQYSTGNSPRKLEALNRQDGSYIFDAESCNI